MSEIPLRHRLKNRPASFVGRKRELGRLAKAIERAPVSIVSGPGGFGKTALVLATLHHHFADRVSSALHVALGAETRADARVDVLRALGEAEGWQISWPALLADPQALVATAIDLAERSRRVIVIDDLHHADPATVRELLLGFSHYARTSRVVCTTREDPSVEELAEQTIALGPMPDRELDQLARELAPDAPRSKRSETLRLAEGSPWRLRQAVSGALQSAASPVVDVLAGLPAEAERLVSVLALLERPVPLEALSASAELAADLEQRGLIERVSGGVRLDHQAADQLAKEKPGELARDVARALAESADPGARLEAIRLLLSAGAADAAQALLDRAGRALLEEGAAPELWRWLEPVKDPRLALWRLRTAVQLGDKRALETIGDVPASGSDDDVLAWAGAMLARGAIDEALATSDRLARETEDARVRFEARVLGVRAALARADLGRARALLDDAEPPDRAGESSKRALVAAVTAHAGDLELALEWTAHAPERLSELSFDARLEITRFIAGALETNGRPAEAAYALNAMLEELGPRALHLVQGRLAMCLAAIADTECGHLDLARATLDRLMPFSAGVLGPSLEFVAIDLGIASGALSGLGQRLEALLASALARRQASHTFAAARLELQLRALRAEPPIDQPDLGELEPPSRAYRDLVALRARALELLSGRTSDALEIESSHTEVRIVTSTVTALAALLGGDAKRALDRARAAQALAKSHAFAVYEAEALELVLAALLLLDRRHELARGADELSALGRRMGSARFAAEGELWSLAAEPELDRPELVERLAQIDQVAPVAARRARALLGDTAALDALDQVVIARLHERGFRAPELVTSGAPDAPTWGLDARRRAIWLDDGTRIDLVSRDVPWRLLEVLADAGGAADKETLVARIWAPKEYHPLKHDNRLRLAVRELRRVIEVDVAHPERVLTTDDGYALGGKVRRL